MRLLLVDDDAFLRDMYATKFEEAGHAVSTAQSGQEAIAYLKAGEKYDVILMDMVMPGMSGAELLQTIQKYTVPESTKCIVLSNQGESSDITEATRAGAAGYIIKAKSIPSEVVAKVESI